MQLVRDEIDVHERPLEQQVEQAQPVHASRVLLDPAAVPLTQLE